MKALIVVAHPDDETLFFAGLILQNRKSIDFSVICVTDGNAYGRGHQRKIEFQKACALLGVKSAFWLGFPDKKNVRIRTDLLTLNLRNFKNFDQIYTHGIDGEYQHPHHQDVSFAVHQAFHGHPKVFSVAWGCYPKKLVALKRSTFLKKQKILSEVYSAENEMYKLTQFPNWQEGFCRCSPRESARRYKKLLALKMV